MIHLPLRRAPRATAIWLSRVIAAVTAVTSAFGAISLAPPRAEAATAVTAVSFNVCGVKCRLGEINKTAANAAGRITGNKASVAFLQEICYSQYRKIASTL